MFHYSSAKGAAHVGPERSGGGRSGLARRLKKLVATFTTSVPLAELPRPDPAILRATQSIAGPIYDRWFRAEVRYMERIPAGQTMLVGHHDGGVMPLDAACFGVAWFRRFGSERPIRGLMHEIPFHVSSALTRWLHGIGVVSAAPANLEKLLDAGQDVLLYPGATREAFRTYARRRDITLGGRSGFVARALRRGIPVTPIVSAGGHETFFILRQGSRLADWVGLHEHFRADSWPLAVGLPWGLWFAPMVPYLPLPSKITIEVLPPIDLRAALAERLGRPVTAADAADSAVVRAGFELVLGRMRAGVGRLYDERRWPVLG
jgi:1-acyl-sn-glycerol-3-phosphate acyltransferase